MSVNKILGDEVVIVNQILPHKNKWAWDLYLRGCNNNWMPTEIPMQKDVEQWKSNILTEDERLVIKRCLGFFACAESLVGNNLLLTIFKWINDGEIRQYISRQMFEETLHNLTVVYCCDSLNLDINEIYEAYLSIKSIKEKDQFLMNISHKVNSIDFTLHSLASKREFVKNLYVYYILCEGLLFYTSFAALLSLKRRNLMPGIGQQIEYTLRDEAIHVEFGISLFNYIRQQEPEIFDGPFLYDLAAMMDFAVSLEQKFAQEMIPNGILGLDKNSLNAYTEYIGNRRMAQINLPSLFSSIENPFPWLSENIELPKMKNFFESRVTDYRVGGLIQDY